MKKIKALLILLLLVICPSVLFACATTSSDTNVYSSRIALYHNNTEIKNAVENGVNTYEVSLLAGANNYVITYFISPSNLTLPGVSILGGDESVATLEVDNLNKLIYITPNEEFPQNVLSNTTSTTFSINANDEGASINLRVNLINPLSFEKLPQPEVKLEKIDNEYYLTWNDDAKLVEHFSHYSVSLAQEGSSSTKSTLLNKYKLTANNLQATASVTAISTIDSSKNSDKSNDVSFTLYNAPADLKYDEGLDKITWNKVGNNSNLNYNIIISSDNYFVNQIVATNEFVFTPSVSETYTITVKVQEGENIYSQQSTIETSFLQVLNAQIKDGFISWESNGAVSGYTVYCEVVNEDDEILATVTKENVVSPYSINSFDIEFTTNKYYKFYVEALGNNKGQIQTFDSPKTLAGTLYKLNAPTSLTILNDDKTITWGEVENAQKYKITVGSKSSEEHGLEYTYNFSENAIVNIEVIAIGNATSNGGTIGYISSDKISITAQKLTTPAISVNNGNVVWTDVLSGSGTEDKYAVYLNNEEQQNSIHKVDDKSEFYYTIDVGALNTGTSTLHVQTIGFKNGNNYYLSSGKANINLIKLKTPTISVDDKGQIAWTKINDASGYELKITDTSAQTKTETITSPHTTTLSLSEYLSGTITITIKAKAGTAQQSNYYFDSNVSSEKSVYKLNNNPQIKMQNGSLAFAAHVDGVEIKENVPIITQTGTPIVYTYTLNLNDKSLGTFETLSDIEEKLFESGVLSGKDNKYTIGVTCSGKGSIISNYNENIFEFYKLPNTFAAELSNNDDKGYLNYTAIENAASYKIFATDMDGTKTDINTQNSTQINLSLNLEAGKRYTFTLQAIGNTTISGEVGYMTSNVYNVMHGGNILTVFVLGTTTAQVTNYAYFKDGVFDFTNVAASSGTIVWSEVESATGYIVYLEKNGNITQIDVHQKNFVTKEELFGNGIDAGVYNVIVRAYGNGANIISKTLNDGQNETYLTGKSKTVTKLDAISNLYTLNNDIKFVSNNSYNNISSVNDFLNPNNIYVEYVVGIKEINSQNDYTYFTTIDFNKISELPNTGNTQGMQGIVDLIKPANLKFTELDNYAEGDYELVVYTMPFNASIGSTGLTPSTSYYITSDMSSVYTIHKTNKVTDFKIEDASIKFNNFDTATDTLKKDYSISFDTNKLMLASFNNGYTFEVLSDEDTQKSGIQYTFKTDSSRYVYKIDILNEQGYKIAVLVPTSIIEGNETGNNLYELAVKRILGDQTGKFTLTIQTLVLGSSLDYANTEGKNYKVINSNVSATIETTILSTKNANGDSILGTNQGVIEWEIVDGAQKYEIVITDANSNIYKYHISDVIEKIEGTTLNVSVTKSETVYKMYITEFAAGNYTMTIKVIGNESAYITSAVSENFAIIKLPKITNVHVVNGRIRFELPKVNNKYYDFADGVLEFVLTYCNTKTFEIKHAVFMESNDTTFKSIEIEGKKYYELLFPTETLAGEYIISLQTIGNNSGLVSGNQIINDFTQEDDNSKLLYSKYTIIKLANVTGITINESGYVAWDEVESALSYNINLNNSGNFNVSNTYVTNSDFEDNGVKFSSGNGTIYVFAKGGTCGNFNERELNTKVYIDGYYGVDALTNINIVKLKSLDYFNVRYEKGKIVFDTKIENPGVSPIYLQIPNKLRVNIKVQQNTYSIDLNYENVDFTTIDEIVFDINNYLSYNTNFDLAGQNYQISFINFGGVKDGVNYTNGETSETIEAIKLQNVSNTSNDKAAISVECQKTETGYILDRIYFEVYENNADYYTLKFVNDKGEIIKKLICKTNPTGDELQIVTNAQASEKGYTNYVVYENTSITEGTYKIVMQAIGSTINGVNYLNSSEVESTEFIVPNAPVLYIENYDETLTTNNLNNENKYNAGTGRVAWEFNPENYKGKTIEYIINYKYIATDKFADKNSFNNLTSQIATLKVEIDAEGKVVIDNEYAMYKEAVIDETKTNAVYYSFLDAGYYLVSAVCYVDGLPSQTSSEVVINFNFFNSGNGSLSNPYIIVDLAQLNAISYRPTAHYKIAKNIDINNKYSLNDVDFSGSISGLIETYDDESGETTSQIATITILSTSYLRLFNSIASSGAIKNINLIVNINFESNDQVYIIANTNDGTIENVNLTLNYALTKDEFAGAVNVNNGTIENFNLLNQDNVAITITSQGASVCLINNGTIIGAINKVQIKSQNNTLATTVGGIVATNNGIIFECRNEGELYGLNVGGICAINNKVVEACVNNGNIEGYDIGYNEMISYIGGIVGVQSGGNEEGGDYIVKCYNTGAIKGISTYNKIYLGGIVGYFISNCSEYINNTTVIEYCYNLSEVLLITDASDYNNWGIAIGGIVGYAYDYNLMYRTTNDATYSDTLIKYCYSTGGVLVKTSAGEQSTAISGGGIAGYLYGYIANCKTDSVLCVNNLNSAYIENCEFATNVQLEGFVNDVNEALGEVVFTGNKLYWE